MSGNDCAETLRLQARAVANALSMLPRPLSPPMQHIAALVDRMVEKGEER
jgi:hypothetical protein